MPTADKDRVDSIEPFDEYEEFFLKCGHYVVVAAACGLTGRRMMSSALPLVESSPTVSMLQTLGKEAIKWHDHWDMEGELQSVLALNIVKKPLTLDLMETLDLVCKFHSFFG